MLVETLVMQNVDPIRLEILCVDTWHAYLKMCVLNRKLTVLPKSFMFLVITSQRTVCIILEIDGSALVIN